MSVISIWGFSVVARDLSATLKRANAVSRKINLTGDLQLEINRLTHPVALYLLTGDISHRDNLDQNINEMSRLFAEVRPLGGDERGGSKGGEDARWTRVSKQIERDSTELGEKAVEVLYIEQPVGNVQAFVLFKEVNWLGEILVQEADEFHKIAEAEVAAMEIEADGKIGRLGVYAVILLSLLSTSTVLLYCYVRRSITDPIKRLHEGAKIIAGGDLSHRLGIKTGDELEDLAGQFNNMAASLDATKKELEMRILELDRLYKDTRLMAITDGLTGLYNHRHFMEKLGEEMERAARYGYPLSLIMIDIDNFKRYNDAHGHQIGDAALRLMAGLMRKGLRRSDLAARYGGEEFSIILPEADRAMAGATAERIRRTVEGYPFPHGQARPGGSLTISLGVASLEAAGEKDVEGLIKEADDALYEAKGNGRNRVVLSERGKAA